MRNLPPSLLPVSPTIRPRLSTTEFVVTIAASPRESVESVFSRLATELKHREGTLLALFVYGDLAGREQAYRTARRYLGAIDWPVLWVEGASCNGAVVAGIQAFAVHGGEVERVLVKGRVVGTIFGDGEARHCLLAGIGPDRTDTSCDVQTRETFENLQIALDRAGFDFGDIARTWFYNHRLLDWYDDFNRVRTAFYSRRPFRSGSLPASTGVEGSNPLGAALTMAAWAMRPVAGAARATEIGSPLQCPAPQYGSSFSRAMEIESAGRRRLLISGTASISPDGRSIWPNDIANQVATTMDVVAAMLTAEGLGFAEIERATAYFKYPLDAAAFEDWQRIRGLALPVIYVHCDICRDDLLFEIEVDGVRYAARR